MDNSRGNGERLQLSLLAKDHPHKDTKFPVISGAHVDVSLQFRGGVIHKIISYLVWSAASLRLKDVDILP